MKFSWKNATPSAKSSIVYFVSNIITKGISVLMLPLFTNILTTSEIGLSNLYNSWYGIIFVVANLSLCSAAYNVGLTDFKNDKYCFTLSMIELSNLCTLILFVIYLSFRTLLNDIIELNFGLIILMFIVFIFQPAYEFWMAQQRYEYKYKLPAIIAIAYAIISSGISIIAVILLQNTDLNLGEVKVYCSNIVIICFGLGFIIFFIKKGLHKPTLKYWKYILPLAIPLVFHSLSKYILDVSDRIMISNMVGLDATGVYSTIYTISSMTTILWNAINASLVPYMFENLKNKFMAKKKIGATLFYIIIFYGIFSILITLIAPEIIRILTNTEYADAAYLVPPIAAGIYLTCVYSICGNVLAFEKKTYLIMIPTIIAAIVNIILNYIFINIFGMIAAAYTTLACYIILSVLCFVFVKITYKTDILNPMITFVISFITIVVCLTCELLYQFPLVRFSIIATMVLLTIIFRKKIIKVIKTLKEK